MSLRKWMLIMRAPPVVSRVADILHATLLCVGGPTTLFPCVTLFSSETSIFRSHMQLSKEYVAYLAREIVKKLKAGELIEATNDGRSEEHTSEHQSPYVISDA